MAEQQTAEQQIITFWLPADEKAKVEAAAAEDERTTSWLMRRLVRDYLNAKGSGSE